MKLLLLLAVPLMFFVVSLATLKDYGVSWDEPHHFMRGQAFFRYLTTGKANYADFSRRRSYFQNDTLNGEYFLKNDSAHPPANDIFAAALNYIFYQKLGIMGDIESLHLFNITISTLLVLTVVLFAYEVSGHWAGAVSGIILSLYPLFFAEGHFNIKD